MNGKDVRKERVTCNALLLAQGACRQSMGWKRIPLSPVTLTKFLGGHQCTLGHGPARNPIVWASQSPFPLQQRWTYPPCPHTRLALIECLS